MPKMCEMPPRPWKKVVGQYHDAGYKTTIEIHDSKNEAILGFLSDEDDLAEHIVKCINEHERVLNDMLVFKALRDIEQSQIIILEKKIQQAIEMLRKLDPFEANGGCYCAICSEIIPDHKPSCDYIKMVGGYNDEQKRTS